MKFVKGFSNNKELAEAYDIPYNTLTTWIQKDNIPFDFVQKFCETECLSYDFLLKDEIKSETRIIAIKDKLLEIDELIRDINKLL